MAGKGNKGKGSDDIYEVPNPVRSTGNEAVYFTVPSSIILDSEADASRLSALSFFSIRRDMEGMVTFTLNGMAKWLGRKPDRHAGGTNDKLSKCISYLSDNDIITTFGKIGNASEADAKFNLDQVSEKCGKDMFAVIYLDELKKILSYDVKSADSTLLVFAWLRMRIARRRNKLFPEEDLYDTYEKNIDARMTKTPEAYDCYYYEIAEDLGISTRTVSKAVDILSELNLIYYEQLPKTSRDGKWSTSRTLFCNVYKRENGSFLAGGEDYYMREIKNKKKKIRSYFDSLRK